MHYYSRILWIVAKKNGLDSYAVQHAVISPGKRWYFSYPEELAHGLELPSTMYVYGNYVEQLLRPYFKDTIFKLGCSSRYAHWKDVKKLENSGKYYLFAGALAGFDNKVVLASARKVLHMARGALPVKIRLHPDAILTDFDTKWLTDSVRKGKMQISDTTLDDDLNNAIVVIGMSTTVLAEALLLGRPVIQINHPDYLAYLDMSGIKGTMVIEYQAFSLRDLFNASTMEVDDETVRERLGLSNEEVTYNRLFS
jgi:hypothetical protein